MTKLTRDSKQFTRRVEIWTEVKRWLAIVAGAAVVVFVLFALVPAPAGAAKPDKIQLCHVTASDSNPYVLIEVAPSAFDGEGKNDHTQHEQDGRVDVVPVDGRCPGDVAPPPTTVPPTTVPPTTVPPVVVPPTTVPPATVPPVTVPPVSPPECDWSVIDDSGAEGCLPAPRPEPDVEETPVPDPVPAPPTCSGYPAFSAELSHVARNLHVVEISANQDSCEAGPGKSTTVVTQEGEVICDNDTYGLAGTCVLVTECPSGFVAVTVTVAWREATELLFDAPVRCTPPVYPAVLPVTRHPHDCEPGAASAPVPVPFNPQFTG